MFQAFLVFYGLCFLNVFVSWLIFVFSLLYWYSYVIEYLFYFWSHKFNNIEAYVERKNEGKFDHEVLPKYIGWLIINVRLAHIVVRTKTTEPVRNYIFIKQYGFLANPQHNNDFVCPRTYCIIVILLWMGAIIHANSK